MLHQNWFMNPRFEMFEDYGESQSFYDTETGIIYVVFEEYGMKGSTIIQEITKDSTEYKPNYERYKAFKGITYKVKLVMSDEYTIEAHNKGEAEQIAREKFGNNYLIDDVIVVESEGMIDMTWDEIYEAADGKACGEWELKRKDITRYEVVGFVEENFGINLETECENVEEEIDYYVEKYGIVFDEEGKIVDHFLVEDEIVDISSEDLKEWCNSAAGIDNN